MSSTKKVAFLVATDGIEEIELTSPWQAVKEAGYEPQLVSIKEGEVQTYSAYTPTRKYPVDILVDNTAEGEFLGLVLPGGAGNPDELRLNETAVAFVKSFADAGKPIAAICHASWVLIEAAVVKGKNVTSWSSVKTDLTNAGATWLDQEVVIDKSGQGPIITSRSPDDLAAFNREILAHLA